MKLKYLLKGAIKNIPGIGYLYKFNKVTGGTDNARYCYAVWLRHLVLAFENGYATIPKRITELGPGDSIGIGLSALISGAEHYRGLDIVKFTNIKKNLEIFDELVILFKQKTAIPLTEEFEYLRPELTNYKFPAHIFTNEYLQKVLNEERLGKIRKAIEALDSPAMVGEDSIIMYQAPWEANSIEKDSMDMILSQTVLQHFDSLEEIYGTMYSWLKKNGIMSHMIDLSSLKFSDRWDGQWTYSDFQWKLVAGKNSVSVNRQPHSTHTRCLKDLNMNIICDIKLRSTPTLATKNHLAKKFRNLSEEDLSISSVFLQAVK
jgi:hypothetical protein